ncbi:MAG: nucleotide exchange factor GrpE [Deltaproteobacteria bacterium]
MAEEQKEEQKQDQKGAGEKTVEINEAELCRLQKEAEQAKVHWDKFVRLTADIENTRKRWERERQELLKYANEGLLADLLNINDEMERALTLSQEKHEDFTAFMKGMEMIMAHLHDLLKKNGIKPMEAEGKKFDPNFHEALMQAESADVPEGTVVEELQKGYMLDNHVLRTAKVKVSRKPAQKDK